MRNSFDFSFKETTIHSLCKIKNCKGFIRLVIKNGYSRTLSRESVKAIKNPKKPETPEKSGEVPALAEKACFNGFLLNMMH